MKQWYLNTVIPYPKAKGRTLKQLIDEDLDYVKWLHRNRMINWHLSSWEYFQQRAEILGGFRKVRRA